MKATVATNVFWTWAKLIRKNQHMLDEILDEPYQISFNELSDSAQIDFPDLGVSLSVNRVAERHYSFFLNRWLRDLLRIPPKKTQVDPEMFCETVQVAFNAFMEQDFGE
ncbi:MAG: hypothetical protein MJH10_09840 [Epibacterium sp.]|nr:hypothetical protein [Epibacterium sp.]NQX73837.1 hypothetical protein [Epibacterium sp.]